MYIHVSYKDRSIKGQECNIHKYCSKNLLIKQNILQHGMYRLVEANVRLLTYLVKKNIKTTYCA